MVEKAKSLADISRIFGPEPLDDSTWEYWQQTDDVRGTPTAKSIIIRLENSVKDPIPKKILISGHKGCGKSTELNRVQQELKNIYEIESSSILERYPLHAVDHRLLLFFCSQKILELAEKLKVGVNRDERTIIIGWFDENSIEKVKQEGHSLEAEGSAGISLLKAIAFKVSGKIYSGGDTRKTTLEYIQDRVDLFILGLKIIAKKIREKVNKPLLLIIENLDKISDLKQAKEIFIENSHILRDIPFHTIFTFPIGLWFDPQISIKAFYEDSDILPMIPIKSTQANTNTEIKRKMEIGQECLKHILQKRIDESVVLITDNALNLAIEKSGGVLRDLFYTVREASIFAQIRNDTKINEEDTNNALNKLRREYENRIGEFPGCDGKVIKVKDILSYIIQFKDGPIESTQLEQTEIFKHLLQNLCILEYNGERWFNLHPLIRDYMGKRKWRIGKQEK